MIRLISIFLTVCMLAGTKCNTPQNSATQHDEHRDKWTRIEANSAEIRAQITSIFSTAHCMDSLLDSVKRDIPGKPEPTPARFTNFHNSIKR